MMFEHFLKLQEQTAKLREEVERLTREHYTRRRERQEIDVATIRAEQLRIEEEYLHEECIQEAHQVNDTKATSRNEHEVWTCLSHGEFVFYPTDAKRCPVCTKPMTKITPATDGESHEDIAATPSAEIAEQRKDLRSVRRELKKILHDIRSATEEAPTSSITLIRKTLKRNRVILRRVKRSSKAAK